MKKILTFIIFFIIFCLNSQKIDAKNNPINSPNNKLGIHITDEKDLINASNLVNSSGGDWGYVTFVITEDGRNRDRWQKVFDDMRKLHLIPIVRIATKANGSNWEIPNFAEINNWIAFLNSLNWVTENRYVIISNEPNHAAEWGGKLDPTAYASYLKQFSEKLHQASNDFFVLPAGFDASARNTTNTMDEAEYLRRMLLSEPGVFENIDGWTSHSYPNPDFAGNEKDTGRGTVDTYKWELSYLQALGVTKDFPVFITETGWNTEKVDIGTIGSKYSYVFQNVWNDPKVIAVTPFILNYPNPPFAGFSWQKSDGSFYPYYENYKNLPKIKGEPIQIVSGQILGAIAQPIAIAGGDFVGAILAQNTGQSIWNSNDVSIMSDSGTLIIKSYSFPEVEPMKLGLIFFKAGSADTKGLFGNSLYLKTSNGKRITNSFPIETLLWQPDLVAIGRFFRSTTQFIQSKI